MTVICGGGPSQQKPGFGAAVAMTSAGISALFNNMSLLWAVPLSAYVGLVEYNLSDFCANDPPPVPTITAADIAALITFLDPVGHVAAVAKLEQLVGAYAWYQLCQCASTTTPAPPAAPAAPANLPQIDPPNVTGTPTAAPCSTMAAGPKATAGFNQWTSLFGSVDSGPYNGIPIPSGATSARVTQSAILNGNNNSMLQFNFGFFNAAGSFLGSQATADHFNNIGQTRVFTVTLPAGTTHFTYEFTNYFGNGQTTSLGYVKIEWYCGGLTATSPATLCCPPDPSLTMLLNNVLEMVTLIQRQTSPFAYIRGTVHAGLSGDGEIAVQGLIGALVTMTTQPNYLGRQDGHPDEYFDVGWINWGTADGFDRRIPLHISPQISLPEQAGLYTRIGYSLEPGVVVSIQELRREY
jgi:hypothetical protein